ncbi:MAG: HD domain-containing protein [Candidatus Nanoarchaeia archaeon]|nr:HD domain-containing protein [Candidatus Nanoarchaeia archaeon]
MQIIDIIYGKTIINEPVLVELINSKPVQRLKGINQYGVQHYNPKLKVTRYDHCVGVMILLRILGASIEEQIAGLLHDVPHTAFSHVIDHVFKSEEQDYHEKFHEKIIMNSEIPLILKKYNFDVKKILDENNFPLLERKLPDLCADRVDYFLRMFDEHEGRGKEYLPYLIIKDNEIIMNNKEAAVNMTKDFFKLEKEIFTLPAHATVYELLAKAIKIGIDKNFINEEDLFGDDDYLYNKLKNSNNQEILKALKMINPNLMIAESESDYDFFVKGKPRYINPKFIENNKIKRVSEIVPELFNEIEKHKNKIMNGRKFKIIKY